MSLNGFEQYPKEHVLIGQDHKNIHIREERFATPIPIFIPNSNQKVERTSMLFYMRHCSNITDVYRYSDNLNWKKSVFDIIEEAVQGIIKERVLFLVKKKKLGRCPNS